MLRNGKANTKACLCLYPQHPYENLLMQGGKCQFKTLSLTAKVLVRIVAVAVFVARQHCPFSICSYFGLTNTESETSRLV